MELIFGDKHRGPPYKCGHPSEPVILDDNLISMAIYMEWMDDNEWLCLDCWSRKHGFIKGDE